jgi:hydrogenase-4 membrane subunit HyfE
VWEEFRNEGKLTFALVSTFHHLLLASFLTALRVHVLQAHVAFCIHNNEQEVRGIWLAQDSQLVVYESWMKEQKALLI